MPASSRLLAALAASLLLHALALAAVLILRVAPPPAAPPALTATLLPPAQVTPDDGPLLKNTLSEGRARRSPTPSPKLGREPAPSAERKLNAQVYYPAEAVANGWEGEVRLLISLDAAGRVADVRVAGSSGYPILDRAAMQAAYAVKDPLGEGGRQIIWPVSFRLQR